MDLKKVQTICHIYLGVCVIHIAFCSQARGQNVHEVQFEANTCSYIASNIQIKNTSLFAEDARTTDRQAPSRKNNIGAFYDTKNI